MNKDFCKYQKKVIENKINPFDNKTLKKKYQCDECGAECELGYMFNVFCHPTCIFYHKYICHKCKMEQEQKNEK